MPGLLILGYVWPEPRSSAAGSRMMQLIEFFQKQDYQITFATTARETENMVDLLAKNVRVEKILLNDPSFDDLLKELNPEIVIFDRYMMEEQFGWRVDTHCPNALKILDTEDLHFLRKAREQALKKKQDIEELLFSELAKREIAAIYRCDLSLIISEVERNLLQEKFGVPNAIILYLPFMLPPCNEINPDFQERKDFISIGNFLHEPNWNAVLYLKENIWPGIRKKLPGAKMNIYGAYPSQKVFNLHNEKENFLVHGWTEDAQEVMSKSRVCLAPIQFGAGIKGKLAEAMMCGTPSVTTNIGSEGMAGSLEWNGYICDSIQDFIDAAVKLYSEEMLWKEKQQIGYNLLKKRFDQHLHQQNFLKKVQQVKNELQQHRNLNFTGSMLKHHLHRSTYFMSKFIEEKNRVK